MQIHESEFVSRYTQEVITEVTERDIDDFVRLRAQLSKRLLAPDEIAIDLQECVSSPDACVIVMRDDEGRIQSTVTGGVLKTQYGFKGHVDQVVTDEAHRGRGLADSLMDAIHEWLEQRGADTSELTSNSTRQAAGRLYERKGYEERPTRVYKRQLGKSALS